MKILDVPQSGSVAGVTSSRNRFGQYRRTRAIPVQPRTPKQTGNRMLFTSASSLWRSLSQADQDSWNVYASQITRNDSLGSGYQPTGPELYVGSSTAFGGPITIPPTILPNYVLLVTGLTYTDPTPGPEAFTATLQTTDPNNAFLIETSGAISPGLTSAASIRRWRTLSDDPNLPGTKQFQMSTSPVAFLTQYKALFPSPTSGQVIWFRFRELFNDGGTDGYIVNKSFQTLRFIVP